MDSAQVGEGPCCPLCHEVDSVFWHRDSRREYRRCRRCLLVFVPPVFHLEPVAEKAEYDLHDNDPEDAGYRRFLSRVAQPLLARLPEPANGLDFGCGPGPALARMLEGAGHSVALYDKYYFPDPDPLGRDYDFVCATEVVEHLADPATEFNRLFGMLRPGGWLAIMTKRVRDQAAFSHWHYIQDPTHIAFYSEQTFAWIARHWQVEWELVGADVVFLRRRM